MSTAIPALRQRMERRRPAGVRQVPYDAWLLGAALTLLALGLVLFVVTLVLNVIALQVVRKYREQYE